MNDLFLKVQYFLNKMSFVAASNPEQLNRDLDIGVLIDMISAKTTKLTLIKKFAFPHFPSFWKPF